MFCEGRDSPSTGADHLEQMERHMLKRFDPRITTATLARRPKPGDGKRRGRLSRAGSTSQVDLFWLSCRLIPPCRH